MIYGRDHVMSYLMHFLPKMAVMGCIKMVSICIILLHIRFTLLIYCI